MSANESAMRHRLANLIGKAVRETFPGSTVVHVPNYEDVRVLLVEVEGTRHHVRLVDVRGLEHDHFAPPVLPEETP